MVPNNDAVTTMKNWGPCRNHKCGVTHGPRCMSDLCITCCLREHEYWIGHISADGKPSAASKQQMSRLPIVSVVVEPEKPVVPTPGTLEELDTEKPVLVSTPDNSYIGNKGGKSGFPISYVR